MKFLPLIWAGLWRKPTRSVLTLLSIVIAFLLFGLLQGVDVAINKSVEGANVDRLNVMSRINFTESLPFAYLNQIETVPGVNGVAYESWFGTWYQDQKNFVFSFPIDPERYFAIYPEIHLAHDQLDAMIRTRTGAIIGARLAKKYGWKIGDHVPLHSTIWTRADGTSDWTFDIVGIYDMDDESRANTFFFNHTYFDEARSFGKGRVGWYIVRVADPTKAAAVADAIDGLFLNSSDETKTQSEKEFSASFLKQFADIDFIVDSILGAVFFALLFLTGNTMMQSLRERIPEIAVLKTLGFTDGGVLGLILSESVVLSVSAALIGLAIAAVVFPLLIKLNDSPTPMAPVVVVWGVLAAIGLAIVTGLPPAWRARRLSIVDALAGR